MLGDLGRGHVELPDQPEIFHERRQAERIAKLADALGVEHYDSGADAYARLLAREPWHWFATLTFRREHEKRSGGLHPEKADKAFRYWLRNLNEYLYGRRWMRTPHGGVVWARGQEFHKDGKVHFHAVLAAPDRDLNSVSRYDWHEFWYREFGRNQIERPRDQADVLGYVSKYVTKDGEVDFSHNFGEARPPRLFEAEGEGGSLRLPRSETCIGRPDGVPQVAPARVGLSLTPPVCPEFGSAVAVPT